MDGVLAGGGLPDLVDGGNADAILEAKVLVAGFGTGSDSPFDVVLDGDGVVEVLQDVQREQLQGESRLGGQEQNAVDGLAREGRLPEVVVVAQVVVFELTSLKRLSNRSGCPRDLPEKLCPSGVDHHADRAS
jgi:hypothetical protein